MRSRILFIVNPISGGQVKTFIPSIIDQYLDHDIYDAEIIFTEYAGHATKIAAEAVAAHIDVVASVGGDGTINEVASALESSGKTMAIIPCGSGNGLARTLKIPLDNRKAIQRLNACKTVKIDSGTFNERKFFNMAGIGFDAHISALFAKDKNRGFKGYIQSTFKEISQYQAQAYEISVDGKVYQERAFMISVANSSQYGNNAHIAPFASLNDGLLDVCVIKPFPVYKFPLLAYRMFTKLTHTSNYVDIYRGRDIKITRATDGPVHIDGEPLFFPKQIVIGVKPLSLTLLV
ncbi:diacylglycerol/lipid kinase family protein [Pedobacter glucosidilyticus]|uniref:diacylglycerol/lipid kinase family protein n=1 Tax=Pedobacter glucosidilyticus TaxID=1122941 RepID=UPI0004157C7D|nr:diacylglycerol kinase family protein [Pedobacter glucosidilyticus]